MENVILVFNRILLNIVKIRKMLCRLSFVLYVLFGSMASNSRRSGGILFYFASNGIFIASKELLFAGKENFIASKELCFAGKENIIASKELYFASKENFIASKELCFAGKENLIASKEKSFAFSFF